MGRTKIAVQLYCARDDYMKDMPGTLRKLSAIGYEAVEFFGPALFTAEETVKALADCNLEFAGWHTPWEYVQDDCINLWIAYCKAVGNRYVIVPGLPEKCTATISAWRETAALFNRIAAKLAKEGMYTGYHNHWTEFLPKDGELPWDAFFAATDPGVIAQYDIGNSLHGGTGIDAMAYHKKYIGRGKTIHAKADPNAKKDMAAIGEDGINWAEYVSEIKKAGVTEYCIVEWEHQGPAMYENLEICYNTLKNLF